MGHSLFVNPLNMPLLSNSGKPLKLSFTQVFTQFQLDPVSTSKSNVYSADPKLSLTIFIQELVSEVMLRISRFYVVMLLSG